MLPGRSASPEELLPDRTRRYPPLAFAAAIALTAGCDRLPDAVIFPEVDVSYSFESGLEGWTASSADMGSGSWTAEPSTERASQGSRSVRFGLANPGGAGKVWLTRTIDATPGKSYTAEITFDLATSDHAVADAWKLILSVKDTAPTTSATLDFQGDTASGLATGTGVVWVQKRFVVPATGDEKGRVYLSVGLWGTTPGTRAYWLDNVQVTLTRTN